MDKYWPTTFSLNVWFGLQYAISLSHNLRDSSRLAGIRKQSHSKHIVCLIKDIAHDQQQVCEKMSTVRFVSFFCMTNGCFHVRICAL